MAVVIAVRGNGSKHYVVIFGKEKGEIRMEQRTPICKTISSVDRRQIKFLMEMIFEKILKTTVSVHVGDLCDNIEYDLKDRNLYQGDLVEIEVV